MAHRLTFHLFLRAILIKSSLPVYGQPCACQSTGQSTQRRSGLLPGPAPYCCPRLCRHCRCQLLDCAPACCRAQTAAPPPVLAALQHRRQPGTHCTVEDWAAEAATGGVQRRATSCCAGHVQQCRSRAPTCAWQDAFGWDVAATGIPPQVKFEQQVKCVGHLAACGWAQAGTESLH